MSEPESPFLTLAERLTAEGLIGMRKAAEVYGTGTGKPTHSSTPTRHATKGITLPNGARLKLEAVRTGGRLMTSRAAVLRFFAAQTEPASVGAPTVVIAPKRKRSVASAKLDALLGA